VSRVCIDEPVGRRLARLSGLSVTGSIGVLLRARKEGKLPSVRQAIERMRSHGIWLSESVVTFALRESREE
jgi:predicted nucleic acid-binding protein